MDPLLEYYLCTKDGDTEMVAAFPGDEGALADYDSVQQLLYWRAVQLTLAIVELERSTPEEDELRSLLSALFLESTGGAIGQSLPASQRARVI